MMEGDNSYNIAIGDRFKQADTNLSLTWELPTG